MRALNRQPIPVRASRPVVADNRLVGTGLRRVERIDGRLPTGLQRHGSLTQRQESLAQVDGPDLGDLPVAPSDHAIELLICHDATGPQCRRGTLRSSCVGVGAIPDGYT